MNATLTHPIAPACARRLSPTRLWLAACCLTLWHPTPAAANEAATPAGSHLLASRFLTGEALTTQVQAIAANLSMTKRNYDPFGQIQDPKAKPVIVKKAPTLQPQTNKATQTSFADIIRRIRVNTIMPAENRFLVGTRSFRKGDRFPIAFRGSAIIVEVISVNATQIDFANTQNGEVASVTINLLPAGMHAGADGELQAPGLQTDDKDAPLELDGSPNY